MAFRCEFQEDNGRWVNWAQHSDCEEAYTYKPIHRIPKWAVGKDAERFRFVEFTPAVPAVPERVIAVHPAVEPRKFEVQYKWPGTGWRDIVTPSLKNHTSVAAAQAALLKTGWESLQTDRANYRILETPANRVHPAFAPPDDVEVEIRVRVPRKTWRGEKSSFQVLYNIPAHSEYDEAEVLSFKEVTQ